MIKANYNKSLLSLISSVLKHYGAEVGHSTLHGIDTLLEKDFKNVVVMLFDGMGKAILKKHLDENSFLRNHTVDTISSVFPPTTTAATTTLRSGLSPVEHGWIGWSLHFKEMGENISIFPNTLFRTDKPAADFHVADRFLPYESVYDKISRATDGEVKAYEISKFSDFHVQSIDEICENIQALCSCEGKKYIYSYWAQPDFDIHEYGTKHETVRKHIEEINQKVEKMCASLENTLVIVTADHGLVDTDWKLIPEYEEVQACLADIPSIESRAMTFFVKDGMQKNFENAFNKYFGGYYELFSHEQVFEQKLFGDGIPNPRVESFVGDYLAVANSNVSLEIQECRQNLFKAVHAGATAEEYEVPLIVIER